MSQEEELLNNILQDLELFKKKELLHNKLDLGSFTYNAEDEKNEKIRKDGRAKRIEKDFQEKIENVEKLKTLKKENSSIDKKLETLESRLLEKLQQTPQNQQNPEELAIFINLDKYFEQYIEHKITFDKTSSSSIKSYRAAYRYLKYFSNENTVFNFSFFKDVQKKLQQLPTTFFKDKRFYLNTFEQVLKITKKEKLETLNPKTINNLMSNFFNFFKFMCYDEIIKENPLEHIKSLKESSEIKREEFTQKELESIFSSEKIELEYKQLCKVSIYTGMRIQEVLSLKKQDIKDNLIHITLQDTSTKNHARIIPIHNNILDTINSLKSKKYGDYLFFNGDKLERARNIGKRVNRQLQLVVKDKTFHSLRKNFSQEIELNTTSEEKTKKYLMGHSFSKDVTHTVYNRNKVNIQKLEECINQITFNF